MKKNKTLEQAIVLCGGLGTRLGKLTKKKAKPLIILKDKKNMIDYIIDNLSRYGFKKILLLCHYQHKTFFKLYHKKKIKNLSIECIYEKNLLGSAGSIYNAKKHLDNFFLLCNGDTFFNFNILDLLKKYDPKKYVGIYAISQTSKDTSRYSSIKTKGDQITNFDYYNKNQKKLFSSGIAIFDKKIIKMIKNKKSLEKDVLPILCKKKKIQFNLYKKKFNEFIDIGIVKDLKKSKNFFKKILRKKTVILDRDGIINIDNGYTYQIKKFIWRKNIIKLIKYFNDNDYYIFIATNQSGVGRGYYKEEDVIKLHTWINKKLKAHGAHIDEFFYAPYFKESKFKKYREKQFLRKPDTGMFSKIIANWQIKKNMSYMIGDSDTDIIFARNANIKGILIKPNENIYKASLKNIIGC